MQDTGTYLAYLAIHKEKKELYCGTKGQVAFATKGALKNSMNGRNKFRDDNPYNYKDPLWEFYEIDSLTATLNKVNK